MTTKAEQLRRLLSGFDRVGIAFSGGVDSSLLLRMTLDILGSTRVFVLHASSCLQKKQELENVSTWTQRHGYAADMQLRVIETNPLTWQEVTANPRNRCYLCKKRLYSLFLDELQKENITILLDGTNADDICQGEAGRPGLRAIAELGIHTPLADCDLNKNEIRQLSRELGLDTADRPSSSCLATRIPHNTPITSKRLQKVATLEQELEEQGFAGCRVRLDENSEHTIYVQLQENDLQGLGFDFMKKKITNQLKNKNVRKIYLDLEGR